MRPVAVDCSREGATLAESWAMRSRKASSCATRARARPSSARTWPSWSVRTRSNLSKREPLGIAVDAGQLGDGVVERDGLVGALLDIFHHCRMAGDRGVDLGIGARAVR